eukprot:443378-Alexandrium_andersonii.AAC.1
MAADWPRRGHHMARAFCVVRWLQEGGRGEPLGHRAVAKASGSEAMAQDIAVVRKGSGRLAGLGFIGFQASLS